jgi:hypothetical protein
MNRIDKLRVSKNNANRLTSTLSVCPSFHLLPVLTLSLSLILLLSFSMPHNAFARKSNGSCSIAPMHLLPNILWKLAQKDLLIVKHQKEKAIQI